MLGLTSQQVLCAWLSSRPSLAWVPTSRPSIATGSKFMCFTTTSKPTFTHLTPVYLSMKCQESGTLTSWYGKDCSILQILAYQLYVVPSFSAQPGKSVDMYTIMFLNMLIVLITRCEKEANDFVCGCSILSI